MGRCRLLLRDLVSREAGEYSANFTLPWWGQHPKAHNCESNRQAKTKGPALRLTPQIGGDEEDRTPDLRIANATLSQLSYGP